MAQVRGAWIGVALFVAASGAQAQVAPKMPEQMKHCENRGGTYDAEDTIRNCTAIFEAPGATQAERYVSLLERARALLQSQNYTSALSDVDNALPLATTARDIAQVYLYRAEVLWDQKKEAEALAELERSIKAEPTFGPALLFRGGIRVRKQQYREALADYDRAAYGDGVKADARNGACWIRAAYLNTELAKALADCNEAVRLAPTVAGYLDSRGMVNLRFEDFYAAFRDYDAAVKLEPENASALYGRAVAAMAVGRPGDADIAAAKAINPNVANDYAAKGLAAGTIKGIAMATGPLARPTVYDWGDPELARRVEGCGRFSSVNASSYAKAGSELAQRIPEAAESQARCFRGTKLGYPAKRQMLELAALNSLVDLEAAYRIGRAEFLANPVEYMLLGDPRDMDRSASSMHSELAKVQTFKTFQQVCGTFDYSMPPLENSAIARRRAEAVAYVACAQNYRVTAYNQVPRFAEYHFTSARAELDSFAPYVCSLNKVPGCVPDSRWREFDRIASTSNVAFVKRRADLNIAEDQLAVDAVKRTNKWADDVNTMIRNANH